MTEYKDAKGLTYKLQTGYTAGDVVVLSEDKAAFRVNKSVLIEASPMFKDMFADAILGPKELHLPDAVAFDIGIFLQTLHHKLPTVPAPFPIVTKAIELLYRYDCTTGARLLLFASVRDVDCDFQSDAFAMASRLDDLKSACRILAQGWKWYKFDSPPETMPLYPHHIVHPWLIEYAEKIQNVWVWSLTLASTTCDDRGFADDKWQTPNIWRIMVGEFVSNLVR